MWTSEELNSFCKEAVDILNKRKGLSLVFDDCHVFANSAGSNFHISIYCQDKNKYLDICINARVLLTTKVSVDTIAGLLDVKDPKQKIVLRIAYAIFKNFQYNTKKEEDN